MITGYFSKQALHITFSELGKGRGSKRERGYVDVLGDNKYLLQ